MAGSPVRWRGRSQVTVGDVQFVVKPEDLSQDSADTFALTRERAQVDDYVRLRDETGPWNRIVHVGSALDGSVPLIRELFQPTKLTAIAAWLDDPGKQVNLYLEARELGDAVGLWSGIRVSEHDALTAVVEADHGAESLDLVIDDTKYSLGAARATFEALFPRLRNGGRYVIDTWDWAHYPGPPYQDRSDDLAGRPAMTNLVVELLGVLGTGSDVVSAIFVRHRQVEIVRGPALVTAPFAIDAHYLNRGITFRPLL